MYDDVVAFRDDELMFVTQGVGRVADQIEQSIATRFNVCACADGSWATNTVQLPHSRAC